MLHNIPDDSLGPRAEALTGPIEACVHCGFCLPTCPTYQTMGDEMNSPRGRIFLMKEALEGKIESSSADDFIDNCLGCQACVTSCPSGVEYGELITAYRAWNEPRRKRSLMNRLQRASLLHTLPHPGRFNIASRLAGLAKPVTGLMPATFRPMLELAPPSLPKAETLKNHYAPEGERRGRVALLTGCAQQSLAPQITQAAIRVLVRHGIEVEIPKGQGCCGALAMHVGASEEACRAAERNLNAFPKGVDAIISTAAGCGSGMKEYPLLFKGVEDRLYERSKDFAAQVMDICEYLDQIGFEPPDENGKPLKVVYHDPCHLAHAQKIRQQPRTLLASLPGIELLEPQDWEICCGSAGTYNIEHPETAKKLGRMKAENLIATGADVIATGNIGCLAQIRFHLEQLGKAIPIVHTVELLDGAHRKRG